jgi:mycoredoxin
MERISVLNNFHTESRDMTGLHTFSPSQIVIHVTEHCPDCIRAKRFFETNNMHRLRVGLEGNREATEFLMRINKGYRSVPTIVFPDGSILVEPGWEELKAKFTNP